MDMEVKKLSKHIGKDQILSDVSFHIGKGKLACILGPSGGGKTTLLRLLAGLASPDKGDIYFSNKRVNDLSPQKRRVGYVSQHLGLFRHLNVFDNIAFGLAVQKIKKKDQFARIHQYMDLTGLKELEKYYPHELSGGQRQRVALARTLAQQPQLLLLDEPFSAIDAKLRKELRAWLRETIDFVGITSIIVTHDQQEAVEIADDIIIINKGRVVQQGSPFEIYKQPQSRFVVSFIGETNEIEDFRSLAGFKNCPYDGGAFIRPEFVELGSFSNENVYPAAADKGTVRDLYFRGVNWQVEVEVGRMILFAYLSLEKPPLQQGDSVYVLIHRLYVFDGEIVRIVQNELIN